MQADSFLERMGEIKMRCREVIEKLETLSPGQFAESWDNVGLLAGRYDREITSIMLAVDATDHVVEEAVQKGVSLLLTHHPLIFSARKKINDGDFIGKRLVMLLQNDICYYAMHTNFDVMGMADAAADEIGLKDREVLDVTYEDEIAREGIGRFGRLPKAMTLEACGEWIKEIFALESVKMFGDGERIVERAAICPGSGKSVIQKAVQMGAEVLITGDIDHHAGIDAVAMGLSILDAGHYGLEKIFVPYMEEFLKRECPGIQVMRAREQSPFRIL